MGNLTALACPDEPPRLYTQADLDAAVAAELRRVLPVQERLILATVGETFGFDPYAPPTPVVHLRRVQ